MTVDRTLFSSYYPYHGTLIVLIADGTCSKVVGIDITDLSITLALQSVLFVPNLDCNLLYVGKLNRDLDCETKFLVESCVFQDLKSGKKIGNVEFCARLFLLRVNNLPQLHSVEILKSSLIVNLVVLSHLIIQIRLIP